MTPLDALAHLNHLYQPKTILLYGSFATDSVTDQSDLDLIVFADIDSEQHDSTIINGRSLDAWIYPVSMAAETERFVHLLPFTVLKDSLSLAEDLRTRIQTLRLSLAKPLSPSEKSQLSSWIKKMLQRSAEDTAEGNYRYHWLLNDVPELYCKFLGEYYDGPVKTLRRMKVVSPELFRSYEELLRYGKNLVLVEEVYESMQEFR